MLGRIAQWFRARFLPRFDAGPRPTSRNSSLNSKSSSTPVPTTTKPAATAEAKAAEWRADDRSEKNLARLDPTTAKLAREHLRRLAAEGLTFKVTSGLRTFAEQDALYAQGRTAPGKVVTKARAGQSWHNFGLAYDLTQFSGKNPVWDGGAYDRAGAIGQELGLEWGGAWAKFKDRPHFQRNIGLTLAEARKKWPKGVTVGAAL
jgi:LAS superfamily LD-carboxypeptidase LdcB